MIAVPLTERSPTIRTLPLRAARDLLGKRLPERPSLQTVARWTLKGCYGVILQTDRVGHKLLTSSQDIEQFIADLNAAREVKTAPVRLRGPRERRRAHVAAIARLTAAGVIPRAKKMPALSVSVGEAAITTGAPQEESHAPI